MDLKNEIRRLCREKNAVIMAHYYTVGEVQDVADFVGDSLALAQKAAETEADIIVMCGVHFMAETCKILCPEKLVLCPDPTAGCSLADSCNADDLRKFKEEHPGYTVVSYVNTTAAVKALTDVVVTSGNARKIVDSLPKEEKIIFGPDKNLGAYINSVTGREMLLWNGGCHVHERFSVPEILRLKKENPGAKVLAHPECKATVLAVADVIGSTAVLLNYCKEQTKGSDPSNLPSGEAYKVPQEGGLGGAKYIVVTEAGILHEMQKACPDVEFIPVPPEVTEGSIGCHCNECEHMKKNSLRKIYDCLAQGSPAIEIDEAIRRDALRPIERMLALSK